MAHAAGTPSRSRSPERAPRNPSARSMQIGCISGGWVVGGGWLEVHAPSLVRAARCAGALGNAADLHHASLGDAADLHHAGMPSPAPATASRQRIGIESGHASTTLPV